MSTSRKHELQGDMVISYVNISQNALQGDLSKGLQVVLASNCCCHSGVGVLLPGSRSVQNQNET